MIGQRVRHKFLTRNNVPMMGRVTKVSYEDHKLSGDWQWYCFVAVEGKGLTLFLPASSLIVEVTE